MNQAEMIKRVRHYIKLAQEEKVEYEEIFTIPEKDNLRHEYLFFIKPEITLKSDAIDIEAILEMMFNKIYEHHFQITDIRILSAQYLKRFNIIAQHYGVINSLSSNAKEHISSQAKEKFESVYGNSPSSVKLIGGIEFLQQYSGYNPLTLDRLWQRSHPEKLAPGTYCAFITIKDEKLYLINGFHPQQLAHYTDQSRSVVALTLAGNIDWHHARTEFIGITDPAKAKSSSLRNILYMKKDAYGLKKVSSGYNGFHLSAGPVEGLVELIRYNSNHLTGDLKTIQDFKFGKILQEHFKPKQTKSILENISVNYNNSQISIFDLTEEKNNEEALQLLKKISDGL